MAGEQRAQGQPGFGVNAIEQIESFAESEQRGRQRRANDVVFDSQLSNNTSVQLPSHRLLSLPNAYPSGDEW